ncbi:hypothetical protein V6N13_142944 [Hibiscus sabdariffa]
MELAFLHQYRLFFPGLPLKRLRVKHRIHITACHLCSAIHSKFRNLGDSIPIKQLTKGMSKTGSLLDGVQLAETLGTAGVRGPQVSVLWRTVKHIRKEERGISLLHSSIDVALDRELDAYLIIMKRGKASNRFPPYTNQIDKVSSVHHVDGSFLDGFLGKELLSRIDRAFKGKELTERQSQE